MRPVVVTGIGIVAPTGVGHRVFWDAITQGLPAIRPIGRFDASSFPCRIAGQVDNSLFEDLLNSRILRSSTHVVQLGLAAAKLALQDARVTRDSYDSSRIGVSIGTALGGWREAEQQHSLLLERGAGRVNPFIANSTPAHTVAAEIASEIGAQGEQFTFSSGCSASLQAIAHGAFLVGSGQVDLCVAGGAESPLIPTVLAGMGRTQELSTLNDDPAGASRPFDLRHCGMVLSEGACALVLERADSMHTPHAEPPYARVLSWASSCDANGLYGLDPEGRAGARAFIRALESSHLEPSAVDYVCAHANSSPVFDRKETAVLKVVFGEFARLIPVSSIKGILGHPFGASGAFQVAATALAIRHDVIPPTHHLETPDPLCDLDYVPNWARAAHINTAVVTSYGYGGINSYLVLGRPD